MTDRYSFKSYWALREESLREVLTSEGQIEILKFEAKKAWNHARSFEHEQILESNVIINKGIYEMMLDIIDMTAEHNKK